MRKTIYEITEPIFCDGKYGGQTLLDEVVDCITAIINTFRDGRTVYICGNGGSMADAEHFAAEFTKNFMLKRMDTAFEQLKEKFIHTHSAEDYSDLLFQLQPGLPVVSLCGLPTITAIANDLDYSVIFAQQIVTYCRANDLVILLSTSGNSPNMLNAAIACKLMQAKSVAVTGKEPGKLIDLCDMGVSCEYTRTDQIQENTYQLLHLMCRVVEMYMFSPKFIYA